MKLDSRLHLRLSSDELAEFERCYQAWLERGRAKEDGRYEKARIWSRAAFARELFRSELRQLAALADSPSKS